jgi:hypothetical protein
MIRSLVLAIALLASTAAQSREWIGAWIPTESLPEIERILRGRNVAVLRILHTPDDQLTELERQIKREYLSIHPSAYWDRVLKE